MNKATDLASLPVEGIDILEDDIMRVSPQLLAALLRDHTTGKNIMWATNDYAALGPGYAFGDEITPERITGEHGCLIMPRIYKSKDVQTERKKDKAEIFTPSWICNAQLNLIDEAWFGRSSVFNSENPDHTWEESKEKITFPDDKTWKDYVRDTRLEITCGEGPYMVSRYDTTTGQPIPLEKRIGIIDRKLRVVGENTETTGEWLNWAHEAFMSTYAYEWQGDSLLLAREALLYTFVEYYRAKFGANPLLKSLNFTAYIVSWNVFQMDGLKGVVPGSCGDKPAPQDMFQIPIPCEGCRTGDIRRHNGTYCLLRDWHAASPKGEGPGKKIRFIDLMQRRRER